METGTIIVALSGYLLALIIAALSIHTHRLSTKLALALHRTWIKIEAQEDGTVFARMPLFSLLGAAVLNAPPLHIGCPVKISFEREVER